MTKDQMVAGGSPKHHVGDTIDVLADRIDPIIQERLGSVLGGLEWTAILSELDRLKGVTGKVYARADLQCQLRVLTERLGDLKFPFADSYRTVSTLGGELRIVRGAYAHGEPITWLDAFRAADFGVRLLKHFGDDAGAKELSERRDSALPHMAQEQGISFAAATERTTEPTESFAGNPDQAGGQKASGPVQEPPEEAFNLDVIDGPAARVVGTRRQPFSPWPTVIVGPQSVIDALPKKAAKMEVRRVAAEIVDFEGPIEVGRLARLSAAAFGWNRLTAKRVKQIAYQIRQIEGIVVDQHGFVWPSGIDAETWNEFRPQSSASDREFTQISPREIANGARHIRRTRPGLDDHEFGRAVIAVFGRSRLTAVAAKHLEASLVRGSG